MELKIEKKTLKRILLAAVLCIVLYWFLSAPAQIGTVFGVLGNIFTPFIVGLVIAFIINVPMRWLESKMTKVKKHWVLLKRHTHPLKMQVQVHNLPEYVLGSLALKLQAQRSFRSRVFLQCHFQVCMI